ncbi:heat-shock protein, partial [Trifolium medium]|nr:heat-shock protein [Trifolium medium]
EGNHCADKLANLGLTIPGFTWWNQIPPRIKEDFGRNRIGMPY